MPSAASNEHLSENEVAAYLSCSLIPPERERVESHLAECLGCRREMIAVLELLTAWRRRRTRIHMPYLGAMLVLAAVAALFVKSFRSIR